MDKNGVPRGARGRAIYTRRMVTADRCAGITLRAACKRRREVRIGPGTLAAWLKVLAPGFLDWLLVKIYLEPVIRRVKAGKVYLEIAVKLINRWKRVIYWLSTLHLPLDDRAILALHIIYRSPPLSSGSHQAHL